MTGPGSTSMPPRPAGVDPVLRASSSLPVIDQRAPQQQNLSQGQQQPAQTPSDLSGQSHHDPAVSLAASFARLERGMTIIGLLQKPGAEGEPVFVTTNGTFVIEDGPDPSANKILLPMLRAGKEAAIEITATERVIEGHVKLIDGRRPFPIQSHGNAVIKLILVKPPEHLPGNISPILSQMTPAQHDEKATAQSYAPPKLQPMGTLPQTIEHGPAQARSNPDPAPQLPRPFQTPATQQSASPVITSPDQDVSLPGQPTLPALPLKSGAPATEAPPLAPPQVGGKVSGPQLQTTTFGPLVFPEMTPDSATDKAQPAIRTASLPMGQTMGQTIDQTTGQTTGTDSKGQNLLPAQTPTPGNDGKAPQQALTTDTAMAKSPAQSAGQPMAQPTGESLGKSLGQPTYTALIGRPFAALIEAVPLEASGPSPKDMSPTPRPAIVIILSVKQDQTPSPVSLKTTVSMSPAAPAAPTSAPTPAPTPTSIPTPSLSAAEPYAPTPTSMPAPIPSAAGQAGPATSSSAPSVTLVEAEILPPSSPNPQPSSLASRNPEPHITRLASPMGALHLSENLPLPAGTRVQLQVQIVNHAAPLADLPGVEMLETALSRSGVAAKEILPPAQSQPAALASISAPAFPELERTLMLLATLAPVNTGLILNKFPTAEKLFTPVTLLFMTALGLRQPARYLLGTDTADALEKIDGGSILRALESEISRGLRGPAETNDWRTFTLPLRTQDGIQAIPLVIRHSGGDTPQDSEHPSGSEREPARKITRFLLNLSLKSTGSLQFDGMIRDRTFNLIIRTGKPLAASVTGHIQGIFNTALESSGMMGEIVVKAESPLPLPDPPRDGGQTVTA